MNMKNMKLQKMIAVLFTFWLGLQAIQANDLESLNIALQEPNINNRVTLKEFVATKVDSLTAAITAVEKTEDLKIAAVQTAINLSTVALERRLESMNEFRGQLKDQAATFIGRTEHNIMLAKVDSDLTELKGLLNKTVSREEFSLHVAKNIDDITMLRDFKSTMEGKASQASVIGAYIVSGIGILAGLLGVFYKKA